MGEKYLGIYYSQKRRENIYTNGLKNEFLHKINTRFLKENGESESIVLNTWVWH